MKNKFVKFLLLIFPLFCLTGCNKKEEENISYKYNIELKSKSELDKTFLNFNELNVDNLKQPEEIKELFKVIQNDENLNNLELIYNYRTIIGFKENRIVFMNKNMFGDQNNNVNYFYYEKNENAYFGYSGIYNEETINYTIKDNQILSNNNLYPINSDQDNQVNVFKIGTKTSDTFLESYFFEILAKGVKNEQSNNQQK